jgi:hypothetical protein
MPVSVKVNGSSNSLVHKGSSGISTATIPDVCKTPSPGGPVPIPYPNISQSATLASGTTTVKADGGMMIAIKGSEFSLSNGDNAGVAGGVKSSTFMKESTWVLYSFDVKMDGQNACRLTDKKFQNHENAADLAGLFQFPVLVKQDNPECTVACAIVCCDEAEYEKTKHKKVTDKNGGIISGAEQDCRSLSTTKHSCVLHSLRKKSGTTLTTENKFKSIEASPRLTALGLDVIPDVIINKKHVIDAKFPCKKPAAPLKFESHPSDPISATKMGAWKEKNLYTEIDDHDITKSEPMTPEDARDRLKEKGCKDCDCQRKGGYESARS